MEETIYTNIALTIYICVYLETLHVRRLTREGKSKFKYVCCRRSSGRALNERPYKTVMGEERHSWSKDFARYCTMIYLTGSIQSPSLTNQYTRSYFIYTPSRPGAVAKNALKKKVIRRERHLQTPTIPASPRRACAHGE